MKKILASADESSSGSSSHEDLDTISEKESKAMSVGWKREDVSSVSNIVLYASTMKTLGFGVMLTLLSVTCLSMATTYGVMQWIDLSSGLSVVNLFQSETVISSKLSLGDETKIAERNLFNKEGGAVSDSNDSMVKNGGDSDQIPPTSLPYTLIGTLSSDDPFSGIATIRHNEENSNNAFFVGDYLMDGVVIQQILRKRVIIDHRGMLEALIQEEPKLDRRRRSTPLDGMSSFVMKNIPQKSEGRISQFKEEGFEYRDHRIKMTKSYKNKLLTQDFTRVLQDAKADPYIDPVTKRISGFRLTRIRKNSIYEKSGLADGDIVKEINGIKLTAAPQAISVLQQVRNESRIEVTVEQDGVVRVIEIDAGS